LSEPSRDGWWARAERIGRAVETCLITTLLGGLILLASAQILLRNVFSTGLTWSDGLTRLIVLWLALLGALAASRDGRHVTMGALVRWLPPRLHGVVGVCADAFAAIVSGTLAWHALRFVADSREYGDLLLGDVPAWWLQALMPAVFALIAVEFVARAVRRIVGATVQSGEF
jgi:TRAP-type C4-dicarboxylate transport system permease small subunit